MVIKPTKRKQQMQTYQWGKEKVEKFTEGRMTVLLAL